jgi:hypothetical protein
MLQTSAGIDSVFSALPSFMCGNRDQRSKRTLVNN